MILLGKQKGKKRGENKTENFLITINFLNFPISTILSS